MLKQEKGITLIALIITIIVLLILSLVTIQSLSGSDSAPEKASQAKAQEDVADIKDGMTTEASGALTDWYAVKYAGATSPTIDASYTTVQAYVWAKIQSIVTLTDGKTSSGVSVTFGASAETSGTHKGSYKVELSNDKASATGYVSAQGTLTWE